MRGLNIVEAFIVAGAADFILRQRPSIERTTRAESHALTVVAYGMKRAGYRYRPGILRGWDDYYEGMAGVDALKRQHGLQDA